MKKILAIFFVMVMLIVSLGIQAPSAVKAATDNWTLVWSDEFNDSILNANKWTKWNGLYYTPPAYGGVPYYFKPGNVWEGSQYLTIVTQHEQYGTDPVAYFTSGGVHTEGKFDIAPTPQHDVKIVIRAQFDKLPSVWPALWMEPTSGTGEGYVNGEIDIMEAWPWNNDADGWWYASLHTGAPLTSYTDDQYVTNMGGFHIYTLEWRYFYGSTDNARLIISRDGVVNKDQHEWYTSDPNPKHPFDDPFFLIFSMHLTDPQSHEDTFPSYFLIDYVRVYERPSVP